MARKKRTYSSPLREEQAKHTRESILEAAMRLLGEGASALTVPAVAKEAGVAVPTVYRHFASKEVLEGAVAEYVRAMAGVAGGQPEGSGLGGQMAYFESIIGRFSELPEGALTLLMADVGRRIPVPEAAERIEQVRLMLGAELETMASEDAERFTKVVAALSSSPAGVAFHRLGLDWDESISLIGWVLRTLHDSLRAT